MFAHTHARARVFYHMSVPNSVLGARPEDQEFGRSTGRGPSSHRRYGTDNGGRDGNSASWHNDTDTTTVNEQYQPSQAATNVISYQHGDSDGRQGDRRSSGFPSSAVGRAARRMLP